jgi:hypothetical protein
MKKYYAIVAGEITYYATDVKCYGGYIHIYGGLRTKFMADEQRNSITVAFDDITFIHTYDREDFLTVLGTFNFKLNDNDVIVPKTETFVRFKSLDEIVRELKNSEHYLISSLYVRLRGINLSRYEELRKEFGERKKSECMFNESETELSFNGYNVLTNLLNFEEKEI